MLAKHVTPILNVSNVTDSIKWFEKFGWSKAWDYGEPPTFGAVCSGEVEIFLCEDDQGGRDEHGTWMSIWVDNVDEIHKHCVDKGIIVSMPPVDEPWGVREMHVKHPDGHTFRISQANHE
jgi:Glyoxalase/Bleomycin resistance protein/Dioxygenase superfamily.